MFIQTERTPNPQSIKFSPGCEVMISGAVEFKSADEAVKSPLARRMFDVNGITEVFLGKDFITLTKDNDISWEELHTDVLAAIMEHFTSGDEVIIGEGNSAAGDDIEIVKQIKALLESHVRPAVARDGGDIVFSDYEDGIVYVHLQGACSGCPGAHATLKQGVENLLKHFIPEIVEVRAC